MTEYFVGVTQSTIGRIFTFVEFTLTSRQIVSMEQELIGKLPNVSIAVTNVRILTHPHEDGTNNVVAEALTNVLGGEITLLKH